MLFFLANLSNNLSYKPILLHWEVPICFALSFLANLSNDLSYVGNFLDVLR